MRRPRIACLVVLVVLNGVSAVRADMLVAQYAPQVNDRFYSGTDPAKAFIGDAVSPALDFSGVGYTSNGRWITMVSPTYFLSSDHHPPLGGDTVTFYSGNDTSQPSATYTVKDGYYITSISGAGAPYSDLFLGELTTPVAANIAKYPIPILGQDSAYLGQPIYVYGLSSILASTPVVGRVGTNTIASIYTLDYDNQHTTYTRVMEFDYNAALPNNAYLEGGDSGGPSFLVYDGQLALVGIHYYDDTDPMVSGDSFVPYYVDQLDAHMTGEQLTFVPEPGSLVLLATGLGVWLVFRRRGRRRR